MAARKSSIQRNKRAIAIFLRLLRSGKDYTTEYMYSEAGKAVYMEISSVSMIIRNFYKDEIINQTMIDYYKSIKSLDYDEKMKLISHKYHVCPRESRLVIRYLNRILLSQKALQQ